VVERMEKQSIRARQSSLDLGKGRTNTKASKHAAAFTDEDAIDEAGPRTRAHDEANQTLEEEAEESAELRLVLTTCMYALDPENTKKLNNDADDVDADAPRKSGMLRMAPSQLRRGLSTSFKSLSSATKEVQSDVFRAEFRDALVRPPIVPPRATHRAPTLDHHARLTQCIHQHT
jgi:hypothetical protein